MPCTPSLNTVRKISQAIYFSAHLRWLPASFFSAGKIIQSAGQTLVGVNATLARFSGLSIEGRVAIAIVLALINVAVNSLTRAPKIYQYFLLPKIYLSAELPLINTLHWPDGYVLSLADNTLYQIDHRNDAIKTLSLTTKGLRLLEQFHTSLLEHDITFLSPAQSQRFMNPDLTAQHFALLSNLLSQTTTPHAYYMASMPWLDKSLYIASTLSILPASMSAYLSAVSLMETIYPCVNLTAQISIGLTIAVCSFVSYANFNVPKMHEGVSAFCKSLDEGFGFKKDFGLAKKAFALTLASTFFGILAGAGMSFLFIGETLNKFPPTQTLADNTKQAIALLSVATSLFPSIFASAYSCYDLMKSQFPETNAPAYCPSRPLYAIFILLIDSSSNALSGFIGLLQLIDRYLPTDNTIVKYSLLTLSILSLLNTIIMNFSLGLVGSEQAINRVNRFSCWRTTTDSIETTCEPTPTITEDLESATTPAEAARPMYSQGLGLHSYEPLTTSQLMPSIELASML